MELTTKVKVWLGVGGLLLAILSTTAGALALRVRSESTAKQEASDLILLEKAKVRDLEARVEQLRTSKTRSESAYAKLKASLDGNGNPIFDKDGNPVFDREEGSAADSTDLMEAFSAVVKENESLKDTFEAYRREIAELKEKKSGPSGLSWGLAYDRVFGFGFGPPALPANWVSASREFPLLGIRAEGRAGVGLPDGLENWTNAANLAGKAGIGIKFP